MDISPFLLERFQEGDGGRYGVPLYCADLRDPPPGLSGRYDAIVGFFVLHHLSALDVAFESMALMLKPGGKMVFVEPNPWNPLYYLQILLTPGMRWRAERGILSLTPKVLDAATRRAGLDAVRIRRYSFLPPQLYNREWGRHLDRRLGSISALEPLLPFEVIGVAGG